MTRRHARAWRHVPQAVIAAGMLLTAAVHAAPVWNINTAGSHAGFSVRVFWLHTIHGSFSRLGGHVDVLEGGRSMRVRAWIDARTVSMKNPRYERWLLSPDFFDAQHYPRIRFASDVVPRSELTRGGPLRGLVTIRGITRFADFRLQPVNCAAPAYAPCVVRLSGHIRRSDFGMTAHRTIISDRVQLDLSIELRHTGAPAAASSSQG